MRVFIPDEQHTRAFGRWLATQVSGGQVISLEGPLGAGKTTLLQGLAEGLGISDQLTSPTFILFRVLPVSKSGGMNRDKKGSAITQLVHADAYRVADPKELVATGFTEYVGQSDTLVVVEWGDRVSELLGKASLHIKLDRPAGKDGREILLPASLGKPPKDWYKN
jgi:tRNA threonylcarbamoyladenosine biosynthesis protein TsaE